MARYDDDYRDGYRDYRDRRPRQPQQPRPQPRYPDEDEYDGDYPAGGYCQEPPYYASPYDTRPQRPPRNQLRPGPRYPEQPQYGYQDQYPPQYRPQGPRNNNRPRYDNRPPQYQYENRPQRPPRQRDDNRSQRPRNDRPQRRVPDVGFNPGTFSLELGDLVRHRTTGLEMTVIRFGREQVECRIHADMSPNWFYESELEFIHHEGEAPEHEVEENDDPQ